MKKRPTHKSIWFELAALLTLVAFGDALDADPHSTEPQNTRQLNRERDARLRFARMGAPSEKSRIANLLRSVLREAVIAYIDGFVSRSRIATTQARLRVRT